jgi:hypothetical protein
MSKDTFNLPADKTAFVGFGNDEIKSLGVVFTILKNS